jgi:hypothetical protein
MKYFIELDEKNQIISWLCSDEKPTLVNFIEIQEKAFNTLMNSGVNCYKDGKFSVKDFRTIDEKLSEIKTIKTIKINTSTKTKIISGFTSIALGVEHKYQSEEIDQLNLLDKVAAGVNQKIKCSADDGKTWELKMHTIEQLKNVLKDGSLYKNQLLESGEALKNKVRACKTLKELELVKI